MTWSRRHLLILPTVIAVVLVVVAGCSESTPSPDSSTTPSSSGPASTVDPSTIDPADFSTTIDNRYLPLKPGSTRVYESADGGARVEVTVTSETKTVMGVTCVVVHDRETEDGNLVEDTFDWFAQDKDGNVWYFGEETKEYEGGEVVSTAGSWEGGVDGAIPGIIMKADPQVGDVYQQEYLEGEAEDKAEVLALGESVTVSFGPFADVLRTREWPPLEPGVAEEKLYAPGVGLIQAKTVEGGSGQEDLVEVNEG
jgi:hypothetical protein